MRHLPNFITLLNLFLGCIAIVCAMNGNLNAVPYLVAGAALADFADGFTARLLHVSSPMGLQLDSLADMVTFGVVPGVTMYRLLQQAHGGSAEATLGQTLPAFIITVFSALRLAKFNIDERQIDGFIGLPTPANTLFVVSLIWVAAGTTIWSTCLHQPMVLYGITLLFSYLLVAELPMLSNKIKHWGIKGNETRLIFLAGVIALLAFWGIVGISASVLWYVLLSLILKYLPQRFLPGNTPKNR